MEINRIGNGRKTKRRGIPIIEVTAGSFTRYLMDPGSAIVKNAITTTDEI
jgi:hypothetical protein